MAWIVAGAVAWQREGLNPPPAVEYATREYIDEQNHLPAFVRDSYVLNPAWLIQVSVLQQDYAGWCVAHGVAQYDYQRKVVPFLRGVMKLTLVKTKTGNVWKGLAPRL